MIIDGGVKPELACAKDVSRPVLCHPYYDADNGVVVAADGFILVSIPVEKEDGDESGHIHADALKEARKSSKLTVRVRFENGYTVAGVVGQQDIEVRGKTEVNTPFPDWKLVMSDRAANRYAITSFSPKRFFAVCRAMDAMKDRDMVTLHVKDFGGPICVRKLNDNATDNIGLVTQMHNHSLKGTGRVISERFDVATGFIYEAKIDDAYELVLVEDVNNSGVCTCARFRTEERNGKPYRVVTGRINVRHDNLFKINVFTEDANTERAD